MKYTYITDNATGEVYKTTISPSIDYVNDDGYLFWCNKLSTRTFNEIDLPESLSDAEIGKFYKICKMIHNGTNFLEVKKRGYWKPATLADIAMRLNLRERQCKDYIAKLRQLHIIAKFDSKDLQKSWYVVNPIYCFGGKRLNKTLFAIFRELLQELLPKFAVTFLEEKPNCYEV